MGIFKKIALKSEYLQVPNKTAKHCENELSLQALGLLVNISSYADTWELHKTELYKRYEKNGRTSVKNAWDELVENNYILEFKYRNGKNWEYVYCHRIVAFDEQEKKDVLKEAKKEYGNILDLKLKKALDSNEFSTVDFEQSKMSSPFCAVQNEHISNTKEIKTKEIKIKEKNIKSVSQSIEVEEKKSEIPERIIKVIRSNDRLTDRLDIIEKFYLQYKLSNGFDEQKFVSELIYASNPIIDNFEKAFHANMKRVLSENVSAIGISSSERGEGSLLKKVKNMNSLKEQYEFAMRYRIGNFKAMVRSTSKDMMQEEVDKLINRLIKEEKQGA